MQVHDYLNGESTLIDCYGTTDEAVRAYLDLAYEAEPAELLAGHAIVSTDEGRPCVLIHYCPTMGEEFPDCVVTYLGDGQQIGYRRVETEDSYKVERIAD
jgi:hypothetical protein